MTIDHHRLVKIDAVLEVCAISRSSLYEMISRGEFPAPVRVGVRAVAWRQAEVLEWIESRPQVTNTGPRSLTPPMEGRK